MSLKTSSPAALTIRMIVDLEHAKKVKTLRPLHLGYWLRPGIDAHLFAGPLGGVDTLRRTGGEDLQNRRRWRLNDFWLETVAAQNILKFPFGRA